VVQRHGKGLEVMEELEQEITRGLGQDVLVDLLCLLCFDAYLFRGSRRHHGCTMLLACLLDVDCCWVVVVMSEKPARDV
jgi:hypothetical protein